MYIYTCTCNIPFRHASSDISSKNTYSNPNKERNVKLHAKCKIVRLYTCCSYFWGAVTVRTPWSLPQQRQGAPSYKTPGLKSSQRGTWGEARSEKVWWESTRKVDPNHWYDVILCHMESERRDLESWWFCIMDAHAYECAVIMYNMCIYTYVYIYIYVILIWIICVGCGLINSNRSLLGRVRLPFIVKASTWRGRKAWYSLV